MWISATNFKQLKTVLYKQYKCCYFSTLWGSKSVCYKCISKFVIITEIIISNFFLQGFVKNIAGNANKISLYQFVLNEFYCVCYQTIIKISINLKWNLTEPQVYASVHFDCQNKYLKCFFYKYNILAYFTWNHIISNKYAMWTINLLTTWIQNKTVLFKF